MIEIVKVVGVRASQPFRLVLDFSTGERGEVDLQALVGHTGFMVKPLKDTDYFAKVFVQNGVPTWPNGFELDAIALYRDAERAGTLSKPAA